MKKMKSLIQLVTDKNSHSLCNETATSLIYFVAKNKPIEELKTIKSGQLITGKIYLVRI